MSKTYSAGIVTAYGVAKRAGYQGTYEEFCRQQAGYAENAAAVEQAKNTAVSAASTATAKAGEATTAATAAQTAKTQTEAAASQALTDIGTARSGAISAVQTEGATQTANATAQAQAAATSATTASTKASEASTSATNASQSAANAAASATSAANAASAAQGVLDSIPEDYSDLSRDVDDLKADLDESVSDLKSAITEIHNEKDNFGWYATFVNGGMTSGVVDNNYKNRVTSDHLFEFDRAITLTPADGFRIYYSDLVNGSYINRGWHTEPVTLLAGTKFKIVIARVNEAPTSFYEDIGGFVRAVTFATETEYRLNALESYKVSADNIVTQVLSASKIVSGKYLDSSGVLKAGNNQDRLYYFDVEPDKNVIVKNISNTGARCACGFLDGVFVKAYMQSASTEQEFNTTGVNQIAVSLYYNVYDSVICAYKDCSVFTDYANRLIGDNMVYDNAVGNYLNPVIDFGNVSTWESGYIKANGVTIEDSASYKHSDYIRVYGGVKITATLLAGAEGRAVHFYDENKNWIGYVSTAFGTIASLTFTTLKNAVYIRTTVTNKPSNFPNTTIKYVGEIDRNFFVNDMVNGWYTQGNKSIDKLFVKATKKPILTLIDDDTPTVAAVTLYHDSCVDNNVVGCYAVITQQLASQPGLSDLLKTYEKSGFQSIFHCHSQIDAYNTSSANYSITNAEADMVQGIQEIIPYGFANWRYWCTPFGSYNNDFVTLARKWGMKCLIRSGMTDYEGSVPHDGGKYQISRLSLNQSDEALATIKSALDSAALVNGWVLVTTHMSENGWDSSASQARFAEMITYARSLGFEIKTVGDALEIRDPIYRFFETF